MVSIQEAMTELEKTHQLQSALRGCYGSTIEEMARYAVEIDREITGAYRQHLAAIRAELSGDLDVEKLVASRSLLRNELRDYRDRASAFLNALRHELAEKAAALEAIVNAMAAADGDYEERLRTGLGKLRKLAGSPAADAIREVLTEACDQIEASIQEARKQNQLTVGQFMVEIKTLHKRIESLETASRKDEVTGLVSRVEMEARIASEVEQGQGFALILLKIRNLPMVQRQFGPKIRGEVLVAVAKRMPGGLPPQAVTARWSEDQFIVLLTLNKGEAIGLAKRLTQTLSGTYVCMENGKPQRPVLVINSAVVESPPGGTYDVLMDKVSQYL
jgi:GGDEF domain-containing protein